MSGHYYTDQTAQPFNLAELPGGHHSPPLVTGNNDFIVHPVKQTRAKQEMEEP